MARYFLSVDARQIINLTPMEITAYSVSGGFVTFEPKRYDESMLSTGYFIVDDLAYEVIRKFGIEGRRTLKPCRRGIGRDGIEVHSLFTCEEKPIRIMPQGSD